MTPPSLAAWLAELDRAFTSKNDVPVERIHLTAKAWATLRTAIVAALPPVQAPAPSTVSMSFDLSKVTEVRATVNAPPGVVAGVTYGGTPMVRLPDPAAETATCWWHAPIKTHVCPVHGASVFLCPAAPERS